MSPRGFRFSASTTGEISMNDDDLAAWHAEQARQARPAGYGDVWCAAWAMLPIAILWRSPWPFAGVLVYWLVVRPIARRIGL
jgi:hypothetical protein